MTLTLASLTVPSLLQRNALRKAATDAGFDILVDLPASILTRSSHAPLQALVWLTTKGPALQLSMENVTQALIGRGVPYLPTKAPAPPVGFVPAGANSFIADDTHGLELLLHRAWELSRTLPHEILHRFEHQVHQALQQVPAATEREALVKQRVGQQLFREGLMALWNGRCAISGITEPELLRASHAKPWAEATDAERLDVYNGLLLAAHLDAAFDKGLISVDEGGSIMASPRLSGHSREVLGIDQFGPITLSPAHATYLAWHRQHIFLDQ